MMIVGEKMSTMTMIEKEKNTKYIFSRPLCIFHTWITNIIKKGEKKTIYNSNIQGRR